MATGINDGGPAFPKPHDPYPNTQGTTRSSSASGMSLRDWFAGQVAAAAIVNATGVTDDVADEAFPLVARLSYKMADAMLKARES